MYASELHNLGNIYNKGNIMETNSRSSSTETIWACHSSELVVFLLGDVSICMCHS
jgi:hypothetical protein